MSMADKFLTCLKGGLKQLHYYHYFTSKRELNKTYLLEENS